MADVEVVHPVPFDEIERWQHTLSLTLLFDPTSDEHELVLQRRRRMWDQLRSWGARDGDRWVGTLGSLELALSVPSGDGGTYDVRADGVTAVSVAATHRRRGLLRSMLTDSLDEAKGRGDAVSILIAAEWPIYGRFGYAPAVQGARYVLNPRKSLGIAGADPGSVRPCAPDELRKIAPAVFAAARRVRPGQISRPHPWWDRRLGVDGWHLPSGGRFTWFVHEGPDGPDGLLSWRQTRDFELVGPLGAITVGEFVSASDEAYRDLWGYLCSLDVIEAVTVDVRPVDEPVRLMLGDGRALHTDVVYDFVWLRLLDVPAALSGRGYAVPGDLVLEVSDVQGGYASGRFRLESTGPTSRCTPTTSPADVRIDQRVLASMYLGGYRLPQAAVAGGVEEHAPEALRQLDLMFSAPLPSHCQTGF